MIFLARIDYRRQKISVKLVFILVSYTRSDIDNDYKRDNNEAANASVYYPPFADMSVGFCEKISFLVHIFSFFVKVFLLFAYFPPCPAPPCGGAEKRRVKLDESFVRDFFVVMLF